MIDERRVATLERETQELRRRLERLETKTGLRPEPVWLPPAAPPQRPAAPRATPAPPQRPATRPVPPARPQISFEDLLGGRVLAWVGGVAVCLGIAFLLAVAISNGWIGEGARTLLAAAGSLGLLLLGVWLHDHKGRTDAALACAASGIAGLFLTVVVAAQVYELLAVPVALALALGVGAVATALAVRWEAQGIAALGILGALLSPVLAGAPSDGGTLALLFVAGASAAAVLVWQRWDWLAMLAFLVTTPQWLVWLFDGPALAGAFAVLVLFGALGVATAIGFELRVAAGSAKLRLSSAFLLSLNALVLAVAGWFALDEVGGHTVADLWLAGLATVHIAVGLASSQLKRLSRDLGLLVLVLGVGLADVAFGLIASGPALAIGWTSSGAFFAWLLPYVKRGTNDEALAAAGVGAHISLGLLHAFVVDAPPELVQSGGSIPPGAAVALIAVAAGCFVSGRFTAAGRRGFGVALDVTGLLVTAYLSAIVLDGPELVLAWSLEAAALGQIARLTRDDVAAWAALVHLSGALAYALALEARPDALLYGLEDPSAAALSLGAVALVALRLARLRIGAADWPPALAGLGALVALYLASTALVTPFQPGGDAVGATLLQLDIRQQGQVLLSALWSVVGVAALVVGLRRDLRAVRLAGLALLLTTVAKVFLYDLATLTSLYRVVSFIALGVLLLAAAFVWQRLRPRPLEDLRAAPPALR